MFRCIVSETIDAHGFSFYVLTDSEQHQKICAFFFFFFNNILFLELISFLHPKDQRWLWLSFENRQSSINIFLTVALLKRHHIHFRSFELMLQQHFSEEKK